MTDAIPRDLIEAMAEKFRLLGDASRLRILSCLVNAGEKSVGEVGEATGRTAANVSKHLKLLADGGVLGRRKEGLQVFYRVADPVWERVCRLVSESIREAPEP